MLNVVKHNFPTIPGIKNWLRTTMLSVRLNNLALISIDKKSFKKVLKDPTSHISDLGLVLSFYLPINI